MFSTNNLTISLLFTLSAGFFSAAVYSLIGDFKISAFGGLSLLLFGEGIVAGIAFNSKK